MYIYLHWKDVEYWDKRDNFSPLKGELNGLDNILSNPKDIRRFLFKGCLGPKNVEKSYHYITYFLIAFGCLIGLIFHICTVYNAAKSK